MFANNIKNHVKLPVFLYLFIICISLHPARSHSGTGGNVGDAMTSDNRETAAALMVTNSRLPSGVPEAALDTETLLPEPDKSVWPFIQGAPRTSGTGRYAHGAFYWTDFIYDANGGVGLDAPIYRPGAPTGGTFAYPDDNMAGNGADIFRVGIGRDNHYSYWRVDWQTLIDVNVPIAAFALDYIPGSGQDEWPGVPRLRSSEGGIDAVLVISANGAWLHTPDAEPRRLGNVDTDLESRSFVFRLPLQELDPMGTWTIWLAAGINDGEGAFRDDMNSFRGLPTEPPVFNVAFRDYVDEPSANNYWFDQTQANQLAQGDVAGFSYSLDWAQLETSLGNPQPEPMPTGYINRWYAASVFGADLSDIPDAQTAGIYRGPDGATAAPQYFDQVQPYGLYVPESYTGEEATKFTLMLHSLTQNHNQYSATVPNFQFDGCELRNSICLTTLGRGPAGSYRGSAEVDLWDAWHDVARYYQLDPERTISSGYSMGAIATINLMIKYPDVFAGGVILAGSHVDSEVSLTSLDGGATGPELMENLKWNGYYQAHGTFDQLVPFPDAFATKEAMKANGYRYVFDHYVVEDHIIWTLKDNAYSAFSEAAKWMVGWLEANDTRKQIPGDFVYRWKPTEVDTDLKVGPVGPWWLSDIAAADPSRPFARVQLKSGAIPEGVYDSVLDKEYEPVVSDDVLASPSPAFREEMIWAYAEDAPTEASGTLEISLENMASLTLDMVDAGLAGRNDKLVCIHDNDASAELTLTGLKPGLKLTLGESSELVSSTGQVTLSLPTGASQLLFSDASGKESCPSPPEA